VLWFFLLLLVAVFQSALFTPLFGSLFLTPSLSFILSLFLKYFLNRPWKVVFLSSLTGLFLDAITDSWGVFLTTNALFSYAFVSLTAFLIFKRPVIEVLLLMPLVVFFRKLFILLLVAPKFSVPLEPLLFLKSAGADFLFILFLYILLKKRIDGEA